jgi:hypothetical protein
LVGDWGLGIGDCELGIGPNPQSPIPIFSKSNKFFSLILIKLFYLFIIKIIQNESL